MLDNIIAFDKAEGSHANITQTNMITVSSFNGVNGALIGYDLIKQNLERHPLLADEEKFSNIYSAEPLFETTKALFGTVKDKHFPIFPGQHIMCAYKAINKNGPCIMYGALAIAIPSDRLQNADLFMEDHGTISGKHTKSAHIDQEQSILDHLILSTQRIGENLGIEYEKIFVGFKQLSVQAGEVGCIITAAPYIHIAQRAIPNKDLNWLEHITLNEWIEVCHSNFLQQ